MPELPEVEIIARKLNKLIVGKKIKEIEIFSEKSFGGESSQIIGQKIIEVSRRAKLIVFELSLEKYLLTHLKMTGQYVYQDEMGSIGGGHPTSDWAKNLPHKHTRVVLSFNDGSKLFFNDMRKFGWLRLHKSQEVAEIFAKLGPDINDKNLTADYLYGKFAKRRISIKQAMMMNKIVCGMGNIYACDSLNKAKLSPFRSASSLTKKEVAKLLQAMQAIILQAIKMGGTTFDGMYVGVDGQAGKYQNKILTYAREGKNCYNCESKIKKEKLAGRGTYFCPTCQV